MADVITRLKVESSEYDAKLKRAAQGLRHMEEYCRKTGVTMDYLTKEERNFVQSLGQMETVSKTARGRLGELSTAFTDLRAQYNRLTQEEKNGDFGRTLNSSLETLKIRIQDAKKELEDINTELGGTKGTSLDFNSILGSIGSKFGVNSELMGALTTGTMGYAAAITAAAGAAAYATQEWVKYNDELARQKQITSVTTGLQGSDADRMTSMARAVSRVYGTEFREVINAANTLMAQFGVTGDEAMQLIRDGMQGMIEGDGPKLLQMIQQYAPAFRDAGVSASQLVAVIHNSEGGIFTDQNMNAIVMGIKNIRLMTNQTGEALAQLGINGEDMSRRLNDGSITVFEALKQVANQIQTVDSNSQAAGQVMQQVFGRQGAMAGTNLGEAIATLNTNLEETKTQTGEVGESLSDLTIATEQLEQALNDCFGYDGWEVMANSIKTEFINTLTFTVETINNVKKALDDVYSAIERIAGLNIFTEVIGPTSNIYSLLRFVGSFVSQGNKPGNKPGNKGSQNNVGPNIDNNATHQVELPETIFKPQPYGGSRPKSQAETGAELDKKVLKKWDTAMLHIDAGASSMKHADPTGPSEAYEAYKKFHESQQQNTDQMEVLTAAFEELNKTEKIDKKKKEKKEDSELSEGTKKLQKVAEFSGNMASGINSIVGGIEGLGIEIPKGLQDALNGINSLISIVSGISTILMAISLKPFANGGIVHAADGWAGVVPGNYFSGDMVPAALNSGEVVLTRAMAGNLASQLQGAVSGFRLNGKLKGKDIILSAERTLMSQGKGRLVTFR